LANLSRNGNTAALGEFSVNGIGHKKDWKVALV
jgi:hypothetical protein